MASRAGIIRAVRELLPQYPAYNPEPEQVEAIVRGWVKALAEFDDSQVEIACGEVVKVEKYFPSTSVIYQACKRAPFRSGSDPEVSERLEMLKTGIPRLEDLKRRVLHGDFNAEAWEQLAQDYERIGFDFNAARVRERAAAAAKILGEIFPWLPEPVADPVGWSPEVDDAAGL